MKKLIFLMFLVFSATSFAATYRSCDCEQAGLAFTLKASYFYPQDKCFREIYKGGFLPLLEAWVDVYEGLNIWVESGYFHKNGRVDLVDSHVKTSITQIPVSAGLGYIFNIYSCVDFYLKLGPNCLYTKTFVHKAGLQKEKTKNVFGFTVGLGPTFYLTKNLFLELFLNYLYDRKEIHDSGVTFKRYLGGLQAGGGIGINF